jgi:hypothetical protein
MQDMIDDEGGGGGGRRRESDPQHWEAGDDHADTYCVKFDAPNGTIELYADAGYRTGSRSRAEGEEKEEWVMEEEEENEEGGARVGDLVSALSGPYAGRTGEVVEARDDDGDYEVKWMAGEGLAGGFNAFSAEQQHTNDSSGGSGGSGAALADAIARMHKAYDGTESWDFVRWADLAVGARDLPRNLLSVYDLGHVVAPLAAAAAVAMAAAAAARRSYEKCVCLWQETRATETMGSSRGYSREETSYCTVQEGRMLVPWVESMLTLNGGVADGGDIDGNTRDGDNCIRWGELLLFVPVEEGGMSGPSAGVSSPSSGFSNSAGYGGSADLPGGGDGRGDEEDCSAAGSTLVQVCGRAGQWERMLCFLSSNGMCFLRRQQQTDEEDAKTEAEGGGNNEDLSRSQLMIREMASADDLSSKWEIVRLLRFSKGGKESCVTAGAQTGGRQEGSSEDDGLCVSDEEDLWDNNVLASPKVRTKSPTAAEDVVAAPSSRPANGEVALELLPTTVLSAFDGYEHERGCYGVLAHASELIERDLQTIPEVEVKREDGMNMFPFYVRSCGDVDALAFEGLTRGEQVQARLGGQDEWIDARVIGARDDCTYDLTYTNGDTEKKVARFRIRRKGDTARAQLSEGELVDVRYGGGKKLFPGKIAKVNDRDGSYESYEIRYDDGDKETKVPRDMIEAPCRGVDQTNGPPRSLHVGAVVEARCRGSAVHYPGKIYRDNGNGSYHVKFDDGDADGAVLKRGIKVLASNVRTVLCAALSGEVMWRWGEAIRSVVGGENASVANTGLYVDENELEKAVDELEMRMQYGQQLHAVCLSEEDGGVSPPSPERVQDLLLQGAVADYGAKEGRYGSTALIGVCSWVAAGSTSGREEGTTDTAAGTTGTAAGTTGTAGTTADVDTADVDTAASAASPAPSARKFHRGESILSELFLSSQPCTNSITTAVGEAQAIVSANVIRTVRLLLSRGGNAAYVDVQGRTAIFSALSAVEALDVSSEVAAPPALKHVVSALMWAGAGDGKGDGAAKLQEEEKVQARLGGQGQWFDAKVAVASDDGTYNLVYLNGNTETDVARFRIRRKGDTARAQLSEGEVVDVRYGGGEQLYPGRVAKVQDDGSYDIRYDVGNKEAQVAREMIEAACSAGS